MDLIPFEMDSTHDEIVFASEEIECGFPVAASTKAALTPITT